MFEHFKWAENLFNPLCFISFAKCSYDHLRSLPLADSNTGNHSLEVDILTGSDYYWHIVNNQIISGKSGPVALSTKLGYILSGPVYGNKIDESATNLMQTHILRFNSEVISETLQTKETLKSFWEAENMGLSPSEKIIL